MVNNISECSCIAEEHVIEKLKHKYCAGNVIPFVGAGLSTVFQMPSWRELLRQCQETLNCRKEMNDEWMAQFEKCAGDFQYREAADILEREYGTDALKETVAELLKRGGADRKPLSDLWEITDNNYKDLAEGEQFKWFFTTNYEGSLAHFIKGNFESYSLGHDKPNMQEIFQANGKRCLFYLHGNCDNPESIVLTSKDYKALYENNIYTSKFGLFGGTKSFLFLGFSLSDKNIYDLINKHAMMFGGEHFIVTRDKELAESLLKPCKAQQKSGSISQEDQNDFCIHPILLCGDGDYVKELRKFLCMLYQTPLIECLQKWVETQSARYDGREGKRIISSFLISDVNFSDGEKNERMSLSEHIRHYCLYAQKKKNFQLIAEGGMGKTVQLQKAAQELLGTGTAVFYIPLYMLNHMTLDEFIKNKILKTPKLYRQFQECKGPEYSISAQTIIMLDGFNELSLDAQSNISTEVMELMNCDGIHILAAGREEISMLPLEKLKLEALRQKNVQCYLKDIAPDQKSYIWKLLEVPMMAQLYKSTETYRNTKSHLPSKLCLFEWRTPVVSRADILWNYLQSQYFNASNLTECFEYIVALEFVACAVAWKMVNAHSFVVSRSCFNEWLRDAMVYFKNKVRSIPRISLICDGLGSVWNSEEKYNHIQDILLNKLNFLVTNESGREVYFCHQYLRDFLAAVYLRNEAQDTISNSPAWNEFMADKNVLGLLGELCTTDELRKIWERQCQANRKFGFCDMPGYYASNWLEIVKRRGLTLENVDFSWQDLRNVRLTQNIKIEPPFCFDYSLISRNTFLSDEHIGNIRCARWNPHGDRIATGSDDGTAKIWDGRNGSCLTTLVCNSAVWCAVWTPDGKYLVIGMRDGDICIWNVEEEHLHASVNIGVAAEGIEVLYKEGAWLLLITVGEGFLVYNVTDQKGILVKISRPDAVAVTRDFQFIIMSFYSTIVVWKVDSLLKGSKLEPLGTYETSLGEIQALVLLETQNKLLVGEDEGAIFEFCLSDLLSGNPYAEKKQIQKLESAGSIYKIEWNPFTNYLAVSTFHGVMIWDEWFQNRLYEEEINCDGLASWSPDGRRLMIQRRFGSGIDIIDFSMYRESIQPERLITTYPWMNGRYSWSPGGTYLACASGSVILIWNLRRKVLVTRLNYNEEIIGSAVWSDDESTIYFLKRGRGRRCRNYAFETQITYTAACFKLSGKREENYAKCEWSEEDSFSSFDAHMEFQLDYWSPNLKNIMLEHNERIYLMKLSDQSIVPLAPADAFKHRGTNVVVRWNKDSQYVIGVCDHQFYIIWDSTTGKIIEQFNINKKYIEEFRDKHGIRSSGTTIYFDKKRTRRKRLKGKFILDIFSGKKVYIFCQLDLKLNVVPDYTLNTSFSNYVVTYETEDGKKECFLSLDGESIIVNADESMPVYLRQGEKDKLLFCAPVHEILRYGVKWLNNDYVRQETETDIIVRNIRTGQEVRFYHKDKQDVREYVLSPYSDDFIGVQYAEPDKFECFWYGRFDEQTPLEIVPFIKSFPLIGSSFHGAQFQDKELERAIFCSGGQLDASCQEH